MRMFKKGNPLDMQHLNLILNHPDVKPNILKDDDPYDFVDGNLLVMNPDNVIYLVSGGVVVYNRRKKHVYEGHVQFLPSHRGKHAIESAKQTLQCLKEEHEARFVIAKVPEFNKASKKFVSYLGFKRIEKRPLSWKKDGIYHDVEIFEKDLQWVA